MLAATTAIEREVRARLRSDFAVTLPRFDLMAALERAPDGLTMGEISRRLMVSNGNVTGVVERLVQEGLVRRWSPPDDRRTARVALTTSGTAAFRAMAAAHERWIEEMLHGLDEEEADALTNLLVRTRASVEAVARPRTGSGHLAAVRDRSWRAATEPELREGIAGMAGGGDR